MTVFIVFGKNSKNMEKILVTVKELRQWSSMMPGNINCFVYNFCQSGQKQCLQKLCIAIQY